MLKKLLATAAVAAGLAALVAPASPVLAAPSEPAPGSTLVCALNYHLQKQFGPGGGPIGAEAYVDGTCLGLAGLQSFPVTTTTPGGTIGLEVYQCIPPVVLDMRIGTGRYFTRWSPFTTTDDLTLPGLVAAAAGPMTQYSFAGPANGFGAFAGTADCSPEGGTVDGVLLATLTVGDPYAGV